MKPDSAPDVFVSYKSEDRPEAARLVEALEASGLKIWWDRHIGPGDIWRQAIADNLDAAPCVLVLWTQKSAGPEGRFVQDEATRALRRGSYLGVRLESVEMPIGFGGVQTVDLKDWKGKRTDPKFEALLAGIRRVLSGEHSPPVAGADRTSVRAPSRRTVLVAGGAVMAGLGGALAISRDLRCTMGLCGTVGGDGVSAIAVMQFRAIGSGEEPGYVASGLTEELRGALARLPSIRVAARTSSNLLGAADLDLKEIARKLQVQYVLDGSVQGAGDALRINTALVKADTGLEEWSQSFDRQSTDLLALQTSIATSVAETLRGRLSAGEMAAVARRSTGNAAAFEAYLRGRKYLDLAKDQTTDRAALEQFDRALSLDPGFAAAAAGRARALQALSIVAPTPGAVRSLSDAALASAQAAARAAPDLPEVQSTLGYILQNGQLDFPAAGRLYARSLALAPNDADILIRYGLFNVRVGQTEAGLTALEKATRLDPVNPRAFRALGLGSYGARRYDQAIQAMRRALALAPDTAAAHAVIGDSLFRQGKTDAALVEYRLEKQDFTRESGLAIALFKAGDRAGAEAAFARLSAIGEGSAYQQAQVLAEWDRPSDALATLERAFELRDSGIIYARNDPAFDGLRGDQRFQALLRRLQLG